MRNLMILILVIVVVGGAIGGWAYLGDGQSNAKNVNSSSGYELETACVHPGYGEFNAHVLSLAEKSVSLHVGESAEISGTVEGRAFFTGNETCYYLGNVTLRAYLGPKLPKDSWNYMSGKLRGVNGLKIVISPARIALAPGKSVPFIVKITAERAGTYYLYVVALSNAGWRSWAVVRVTVG